MKIWVNTAGQSVEVYLLRDHELVFDHVYTVHPEWMLKGMKDEERAAVVTHFKCSLLDDLDISLDGIFDDLLP